MRDRRAAVFNQKSIQRKVNRGRVQTLAVSEADTTSQGKVVGREIWGNSVALGEPRNDARRAATIVPQQRLVDVLENRVSKCGIGDVGI